jgi:hypothetical protein
VSIVTLEGIVEHGQVRLPTNVRLPENTRVYVVVPDAEIEQVARVFSPRLARPEQASDFAMETVEGDSGAEADGTRAV